MRKIVNIVSLILMMGLSFASGRSMNVSEQTVQLRPGDRLIVDVLDEEPTSTPQPSETSTDEPTSTIDATETSTITETPSPTNTLTPTITNTPGNIAPFANAPACPPLDNNTFHTLWNSVLGCHYDHEHGTNPFTSQVAATFPGFNLFELLGNVQVGHTNPSSDMENTHKHGGMKWDVELNVSCESFESNEFCVRAAVIQYHAFGDYAVEMETRIHSTVALLKVCSFNSPNDCGYLYTVQHQEYGQRVSQYQGDVVPYPNNPQPSYGAGFGQYFTIDRYGNCVGCRPSLEFVRTRNINAASIWTSKETGAGVRPEGSDIFRLLFRVRKTYQLLQWSSVQDGYPFHFGFVCGDSVYNPVGCRYTNTTTKVHEVEGDIPSEWDNLDGFDINPVVGRITAEGFTDRFGNLMLECIQVGESCFPIKLVNMYVGYYGGALPGAKISNMTPGSNPDRNICFNTSGRVVDCDASNSIPSGWVGAEN